MTTARIYIIEGAPWPLGTAIKADGSDVVIGTVVGHGAEHDGRVYAEVELTPAALGVGYERPTEDEEEDPFG